MRCGKHQTKSPKDSMWPNINGQDYPAGLLPGPGHQEVHRRTATHPLVTRRPCPPPYTPPWLRVTERHMRSGSHILRQQTHQLPKITITWTTQTRLLPHGKVEDFQLIKCADRDLPPKFKSKSSLKTLKLIQIQSEYWLGQQRETVFLSVYFSISYLLNE